MAAAVRAVQQQQTGFRLVVVHRDGTDGISYNLLGDQIDIGRTEGDLLFEDPHLANRHARISASLTGRVMTPLEARNGIYVRLRGAVDLHDGDYVLLGKQVLMFELVAESERNVRPAIEHGVVVFGTPVPPLGPPAPDHPRRRHPRHLPPDPAGGGARPRDRRRHLFG